MNIAERIRKIRQEVGLTILELSKKINVSDRTISNYERGERKPSVDYLTLLYEHLEANPEWLLSGKGEMFTDKTSSNMPAKFSVSDFLFIPKLVLKASAGHGSIVDLENIEDYIAFQKDWFNKNIHAPQNALAVMTANGDSMEPTIKNGDMLLVDTSQNQARTDNIYIIRIDDCLVVKRVQCLPGQKIQIISDNKNYDTYTLDLSDESQSISIIGKVVWYGRSIGVE